jgi:hypothetical protein
MTSACQASASILDLSSCFAAAATMSLMELSPGNTVADSFLMVAWSRVASAAFSAAWSSGLPERSDCEASEAGPQALTMAWDGRMASLTAG